MTELDAEESLAVSTSAEIARSKIEPWISEIEGRGVIPDAVWSLLDTTGLMRVGFDDRRGGAGLGDLATVRVVEQLATASASVADIVVSAHTFHAALRVATDVDAVDDETWFSPIVSDLSIPHNALGESHPISGEARRVHHAESAQAFALFTKPDLAFVVRVSDAVIVRPPEKRTGLVGVRACDVMFERAIPDGGIRGVGVRDAANRLQRLGRGAIAVGLGRRAISLAEAHVSERRQFGTRLSDLEPIKDIVGSMHMSVESAASLIGTAAYSDRPEVAARAAAVATQVAVDVTVDALQLHGGYGYVSEYPIERLVRDALSIRASLGGSHSLRSHSVGVHI